MHRLAHGQFSCTHYQLLVFSNSLVFSSVVFQQKPILDGRI